ncbi:PH domain-containing protein [Cryptosporangium aurantiacum]|uniref:PH domain-containing protein n=1 Tax=Cryptosporangium aurantiacum TaxID=134849 RepID=A0A1M7HL00_9ACTN|nr:PH domain-containing protein [Cryptosporangium aurantiacum]SHM29144.1 PH domain-containing protein [Cryptosporangium aurantiacum]
MSTQTPARPVRVRFRQSFATVTAILLTAIGAFTIAGQDWVYTPVMAIPLLALWWVARTGVDIEAEQLTIRRAFGRRTLRWEEIEGFLSSRGRVSVQLTEAAGGEVLRLPAVTPSTLPRLIASVSLTKPQSDAA